MINAIDKWRESGKHLPNFMRDFHDQKDVFKAMYFKQDCGSAGDIGWVQGQIYVIDCFLWFMAKRGYTLQKSRKNLDFQDIQKDIEDFKKHELEMAKKIFKTGD